MVLVSSYVFWSWSDLEVGEMVRLHLEPFLCPWLSWWTFFHPSRPLKCVSFLYNNMSHGPILLRWFHTGIWQAEPSFYECFWNKDTCRMCDLLIVIIWRHQWRCIRKYCDGFEGDRVGENVFSCLINFDRIWRNAVPREINVRLAPRLTLRPASRMKLGN